MAINIPYGYIIKSRKGNSYIKTPSGWVSNGKPANQGIIKNLEAAAERKIEEYNDNSDNLVKIGQEYKSNNGKVYFYNGTNFMSADGKKKLAGGAQESAMRKLQQSAETNPSAEVTEPNTNEVEPSGTVDEPESSTQDAEVTDDMEPSGAVDEPESSTQDSGGKSLQELADIINNHPQKRKLVALMSRGDKVSLIAADIILAGKAAEAVKELTANQ